MREETNGAVPVQEVQRGRLVLALAVRPLNLEHSVAGRDDVRDVTAGKRVLESQVPLRCALLDELRELLLPGLV
jgi:hypothetical protein